ncbi:unnamed protein product, partial [Closterium sp. Yama58-4]
DRKTAMAAAAENGHETAANAAAEMSVTPSETLQGVPPSVLTSSKRSVVLVLDFGSQYTQLITRRIRELGVYSVSLPAGVPLDQIQAVHPTIIVLSGGPNSVHEEGSPTVPEGFFDYAIEKRITVLGICYGMQLIVKTLGGDVARAEAQEYGRMDIVADCDSALFGGSDVGGEEPEKKKAKNETRQTVWMSHGDEATKLPEGFRVVARSDQGTVVAIECTTRKIFGLQYHPEVTHTPRGMETLRRVIFDIGGAHADWQMQEVLDEAISAVQAAVGPEKHAVCALSGGVDSTVAATLVHRAIGDRLHCIFVDNGLLRFQEQQRVMAMFEADLHLPVTCVDASDRFLSKLKGVTDPERKRRIIGAEFIGVFDDFASELEAKLGHRPECLVQGTLYPDVIESCPPPGSGKKHSHTIKSHHNVGGLPENMRFTLVEPLKWLFKDEVRKIGALLNVPASFLSRHPFPGPGLAVRVLGDVCADGALDTIRQVDEIFINAIKEASLYDQIWQAFAVFLPVRSVGVQGDRRTHSHVVALRAITSQDGMTADWFEFDTKFLREVSARICNSVSGVNRLNSVHPGAKPNILVNGAYGPNNGFHQPEYNIPSRPGSSAGPMSRPSSAMSNRSQRSSHGSSQACDPPQWIRGRQLGGDPRSKIHLALHAESGQIFVTKSVSSRALPRDMRQLDNEQAILEELRGSPRVVRLLGADWEDDAAVPGARVRSIFMEYVSGGSIADLMSSFGGRLPEALVRRYARGICEGLRDLHARGIVHCDVRAANVLLNGDKGEAKLCSFGSAIRAAAAPAADGSAAEAAGTRKPPPARFQGAGAYSWMAPEVVRQEAQGCAADIWSFACTVLEMITGEPPWTAQLEAAGFAAAPGSAAGGGGGGARACDRDAVLHMIGSTFEVPHIPAEVSPECRSLLRRCLERDPANRPTAMLLLDHAFLLPTPCPPLFRLLGGGSNGNNDANCANSVSGFSSENRSSSVSGVPAATERLRTPDRYRIGLPRSASAGSAEDSGSATGMAAGMVAGMGPGGFNAGPPLTPPSSSMHSSGYHNSLTSPNAGAGGSGGGFTSPGSGGGGPGGGAMGGGSGGGGLGGAAGGGATMERPPTRRTPLQRSQSQPKQLISTHVPLPGTGNPIGNPNALGVIANLAQGSTSSIPPTGKASSRNTSPLTKPPPPPSSAAAAAVGAGGSGSAGANPNMPMVDVGPNSMNPALAAAIPSPPALPADAAGSAGGATGPVTGGAMPLGPVLVPPPGIRMGPLMRQISKGQEAIRAAAAMAAATGGGGAGGTAMAAGGGGGVEREAESGFAPSQTSPPLPHQQSQARATPPRPGLPRSSSGGSSGNYSVSFGNGSSSVSGSAGGGATGGTSSVGCAGGAAGGGYNFSGGGAAGYSSSGGGDGGGIAGGVYISSSSGSGGGSSGYSAALPPSPEGITSPNNLFSAPSPPTMPPRRPHAHRRSHSISPEHGHFGLGATTGALTLVTEFRRASDTYYSVVRKAVDSKQQHSSISETAFFQTTTIDGIRGALAAKKYVARKEDVPLIKCGVCELLAKNLLRQVREKRQAIAPKKLSELKIIELVESACDVSKDEGDWIQWLDVQEKGDKLELKEFPYPGDCRTECKTIQKACQEVVGFSDTDVAELLYSEPTIPEGVFAKQLCLEMSPACIKQPPPVPKGRKPGEAFRRKSSTEVERERMMRDMDLKSEKYREENPRAPRMPKMKLYSRDDLLKKTSVGGMGMGEDEEDEEEGEEGEGEEEDPEEKLRNELGPGTHVDMEAIRAALKAADEKEKQQEAALNSPLRRIFLSSRALIQRAADTGTTLIKRFQATAAGKHTSKLIRQNYLAAHHITPLSTTHRQNFLQHPAVVTEFLNLLGLPSVFTAMDSAKVALLSAKDDDSTVNGLEAGVRRLGLPTGSFLSVNRKGDDLLEINLPRNGFTSRCLVLYTFFLIYVAIFAVFFIDLDALTPSNADFCSMCPLIGLGSLVLIVSIIIVVKALTRRHLTFTRSDFTMTSSFLGRKCCCRKSTVNGKASDISNVKIVVSGGQFAGFMTACEVSEGVRTHRFGMNLSVSEKQYLVQEIGDFLACPYSTQVQLA